MTRLDARAFIILLGATLAGCGGCDENRLTGGSSTLSSDTGALDFGRVFLGTTARLTFNVSAVGTLPVQYTAHFEGDPFGYQMGPAVSKLGANTVQEIVVLFRPGFEGVAEAEVVLDNDATEEQRTAVHLLGVGVAPPDCEDGNGCTTDRFNLDTGECEHRAEALACDDFNSCTSADTCNDGICLGQGTECNDGDSCTDDLCDAAQGCVHVLTAVCDDGNPCTQDSCDPVGGCHHETIPDGTPCNDAEQCTMADICLGGSCIGVSIPDGSPCSDGDPCSKNEACSNGRCVDPSYQRPAPGEIKFALEVGPLAEGSERNPVIDRDSSIYTGAARGIVAVDRCGVLLWRNDELGAPRFESTVSIPGILSVPFGSKIVDIDMRDGHVIRELPMAPLFGVSSSSTSTVTVRVVDLALRSSGGMIASVMRENRRNPVERQGIIAEVDSAHLIATPFRGLGSAIATRVAIDADEALLAILREGDGPIADELLVRFGLSGLPETSWSTSPVVAKHTEIAIGAGGEAYWTAQLLSIKRNGALNAILPASAMTPAIEAGSPVVGTERVYFIQRRDPMPPPIGIGFTVLAQDDLVALDPSGKLLWKVPLSAPALGMGPTIDGADNVFVMTQDHVVRGFAPDGTVLFATTIPLSPGPISGVALGVSPDGVVLGSARGVVFGVQWQAPLAPSPWPRHRRDNLSTGHR